MIHEIGPIVQEDKDPGKIRRALAQGAGGVIVAHAVPPAVMDEYAALVASRDGNLARVVDAPPVLIADKHSPEHCRWSYQQETLKETQGWLKDQFAWAAEGRLCRPANAPNGRQNLLRLWANQGISLPWHVDRSNAEALFPDIHFHIAGKGMLVAAPERSLRLSFTDNKSSPHLQHPQFSLRDMSDKNAQKLLQKKLTAYLEERGVAVRALKPGEILFFNEKCLHASAGRRTARLRAAIF